MVNLDMQAKYDHGNPAAIIRLLQNGAQLRAFSPEIMEACYKAATEMYAEFSAKSADFKKIHDHYMAYRGEQYLWWQIAEYNYDSFMIRQRSRG
jgi:TRAP-type mannitol/chloroaromatic compound transport system substrate-binding protein